jgi:hypothetical protein
VTATRISTIRTSRGRSVYADRDVGVSQIRLQPALLREDSSRRRSLKAPPTSKHSSEAISAADRRRAASVSICFALYASKTSIRSSKWVTARSYFLYALLRDGGLYIALTSSRMSGKRQEPTETQRTPKAEIPVPTPGSIFKAFKKIVGKPQKGR